MIPVQDGQRGVQPGIPLGKIFKSPKFFADQSTTPPESNFLVRFSKNLINLFILFINWKLKLKVNLSNKFWNLKDNFWIYESGRNKKYIYRAIHEFMIQLWIDAIPKLFVISIFCLKILINEMLNLFFISTLSIYLWNKHT